MLVLPPPSSFFYLILIQTMNIKPILAQKASIRGFFNLDIFSEAAISGFDSAEAAQAIESVSLDEAWLAGDMYKLIDASKGAKYAHCFGYDDRYIGYVEISTLAKKPGATELSFDYGNEYGVYRIGSFYTSKSWIPCEFFDDDLIWNEGIDN